MIFAFSSDLPCAADGIVSQQVVKIQRQQGLDSTFNKVLSDLFELRLSIQDNPNLGIHAGDNKVTGKF